MFHMGYKKSHVLHNEYGLVSYVFFPYYKLEVLSELEEVRILFIPNKP